MKLSSLDFYHNNPIPQEFTCQGKDINPTLVMEDIPDRARSLALIVDDPDAPGGMWVHWVVFNIATDVVVIPKNTIPGVQGRNDFGRENYGGPCPPSGTHRYFFKLYALDQKLDLKSGASKRELEKAMEGHILAQSELVGLYKKF